MTRLDEIEARAAGLTDPAFQPLTLVGLWYAKDIPYLLRIARAAERIMKQGEPCRDGECWYCGRYLNTSASHTKDCDWRAFRDALKGKP